VEIGAPEYVHDFFQAHRRYHFLAARSLGHSVPLVNGCEQSPGLEFAAKVLAVTCGEDRVEFVLDLAACYPPEAKCRKLQRTFVWEKSAGQLTVIDEFELDGPGVVESLLITLDAPAQKPSGVEVAGLAVRPGTGTRFLESEVCPYRDHVGGDAQVHRLRFGLASGPVFAGRIELGITTSP